MAARYNRRHFSNFIIQNLVKEVVANGRENEHLNHIPHARSIGETVNEWNDVSHIFAKVLTIDSDPDAHPSIVG